MKFLNPIPFHPNIYPENGDICLNKYDNWNGKNHYICDMIDTINYVLYNPNPESPYNGDAANLYIESREKYRTKCLEVAQESEKINKPFLYQWVI